MTSNSHNPMAPPSPRNTGEETLRLIASLPVPSGLEDRIHTALRTAPRPARLLTWPTLPHLQSNWMRAAAAAAIVFVAAGGGWGVYSRLHRDQAGKTLAVPIHVTQPGGFSGAGAARTPTVLPGPLAPQPPKAKNAQSNPAKMPASKPAATRKKHHSPAAAPSAQPAESR